MADYIEAPIETDATALQTEAFDFIRTRWPEWSPDDGNLEAWLIAASSRLIADAMDVGSAVPVAIFRYYGDRVLNVPPIDETSSVVSSTWVLPTNPSGRTIEAGTQVVITNADDDTFTFEVVDDVFLATDVLTTAPGAVLLRSVDTGADTEGLGGNGVVVQPADSLNWVTSITLTGATVGGQDAESDTDYLDRLSRRAQLMTPRPILPQDFSALAKDIALANGFNIRAAVIDLFVPGHNQITRLDFAGTISGGTYTLTVNGHTTAAIAWNAANETIAAAIAAAVPVPIYDVRVSGGPSPADVLIEFGGTFNQTAVTVSRTSSLTGGGTLTIVTDRSALADLSSEPRAVTLVVVDADTGVSPGVPLINTIKDELESLREINFIISVITPEITRVDVTFAGVVLAGYDPDDVLTNANSAVTRFLAPTNSGADPASNVDVWTPVKTIRQQDLSTVLNNVAGFSHWTTLTFGLNGATQSTADKTIPSNWAITEAGTISGTMS
jgi:hypothetical protein